jgi:hypothetical protein
VACFWRAEISWRQIVSIVGFLESSRPCPLAPSLYKDPSKNKRHYETSSLFFSASARYVDAILDVRFVYSYLRDDVSIVLYVIRFMGDILVLDAPLALVVNEATTAASAPLAAKV